MMQTTTETAAYSITSCPHCQAAIPVYDAYVTWCDKCNWNLRPEQQDVQPRNLFEKIYWQAGSRVSAKLLDTMISNGTQGSKLGLLKIATLLLASIIHAISLLLVAGGFYLLITSKGNFFMSIAGVALLLLSWLTRPRYARLDHAILPRSDYPATYQIIDEISLALQGKKVYGVVVDSGYNASYSKQGLRRRVVIRLGMPLLSVLDKNELTALLSHEVAHGVNGDLNRGFFVGTAINTLLSWHEIIWPERIYEPGKTNFFVDLAMIPVHLLMRLIAWMIYMGLHVICHLNWYDSQRAEYLADGLAARTSGKCAVQSLLHKLHFRRLFELTVLKAINSRNTSRLFESFQKALERVPERELERIKRVDRLKDARIDVTHPPTWSRGAFIESLDIDKPVYTMSDDLHRRFVEEMAKLREPIERRIIDDYKDRLWDGDSFN